MRHLWQHLLLAVALLPFSVCATQADHVNASDAWIRLLPGDLPASGYVVLHNHGASVALLVSVNSAAYASAMLHQSAVTTNGISRMTMVDHLAIPANSEVALAPAGYHLMLQQARHPLKPGDHVAVTMNFADGSQLPVTFLVRPANAIE